MFRKTSLILVGLVIAAGPCLASTLILGWNVFGVGTVNSIASTTNAAHVLPSIISIADSALIPVDALNGFNMRNWSRKTSLAGAISDNSYFEFTIIALDGYHFDVESISWRFRRSNFGPKNFALLSSVGGWNTSNVLATFNYTGNDIVNLDPAFTFSGVTWQTNVTFRIYGYNATDDTGTTRIQDGANFGATGIDFAVFGTLKPTRAVITGVQSRIEGGVAVISWDVAMELDTVGYYLERWVDDAWVRVNADLIPADPFAPTPKTFEQADPDAPRGTVQRYRIVEIDNQGRLLPYGPYDLELDGGEVSHETWAAGIDRGDTDPDGDGLTNLQEYLAGTDPLNAKSVLRGTRVEPVEEGVRLSCDKAFLPGSGGVKRGMRAES